MTRITENDVTEDDVTEDDVMNDVMDEVVNDIMLELVQKYYLPNDIMNGLYELANDYMEMYKKVVDYNSAIILYDILNIQLSNTFTKPYIKDLCYKFMRSLEVDYPQLQSII